ncbi:1-acyl-sn-glycerol-3-phosphate acyltransferase [Roseobacter cerasinus]|uniref:1-acyl-sn-glycerol-3-phosphate acyltransferase n=1 Tax=Roseobacter cerasinus TaxID=2602289 RepID=A0A640VN80_9RHOB|nr:lysophospholipid acyltransferase family protein [Roseobacter cerasinus]GFE48315.1 1-acyl-sn-glycerol-3-phosphate acyltransferase [Roseobacter cerasinus]
MSTTWFGDAEPPKPRLTLWGGVLVVLRGLPLAVVVFGGLALLLLLRLFERPLYGAHRPLTPAITVFVCRAALRIIGLRLQVTGRPANGQGAAVANHSSWLDIFVLNASKRIYFVSKSEVAGWPGIGWLARATGTVFIARNRAQASAQAELFKQRLSAGHRLLFFPEGTSSDGQRVLPFKTSLFAAFFAPELRETLQVQPISVTYTAPDGADPRFYGWWGGMDFGSHLLTMLAWPKHGRVHVIYHDLLKIADHTDRKTLAAACEVQVRAGFDTHRPTVVGSVEKG